MNYRITCVCGHQFQVSDDQVRTELECPVCHQRLQPSVEAPVPVTPAPTAPDTSAPAAPVPAPVSTPPAAPGPDTAAVSAPAAAAPAAPAHPAFEPTKRCPFCGEVILAIARKCKHCGEFLDRAVPAPGAPHSDAIAPGTTAAALAPNAAASAAGISTAAQHEPVFSLNSSQWDNFWRYVILASGALVVSIIFYAIASYAGGGGIFFLGTLGTLVIAGFVGWFFYLRTHSTHIRIYPYRIEVESGILSKNLESLELFRITDTELKQSLIERIVGIGTINLMTTDTAEPELSIVQIPRAREVLKYLQTQIPVAARQRGAVYLEK